MRILVTGAYGFVGYAVTRCLIEHGHEVVAMTSRAGADRPRPAGLGTGRTDQDVRAVRTVEADLRDRRSLRAAVAGVDAVAHLAALTRVRDSFERPDDYARTNTAGTENLLAALAGTGRVLPLVHASTAAVYSAAVQPIDEAAEPAPASPYAASKLAADDLLRTASVQGAVAGVSIRAFNAAGALDGRGDPDLTRLIPKVLAVASGRAGGLTVNGDGSAVRDYVHVADLAEAFRLALGAAAPGRFEVFNVGATAASVAEVVAAAREVTGRPIPAEHRPPVPEAAELRADTGRIAARLGWRPVRSGLGELIGDAWAAERALVR